jgi:hypothetical protein
MPRKAPRAKPIKRREKADKFPRKPKKSLDSELEGEGIFDFFKPRNDYNNTSKETIAKYGDWTIVRAQLQRTPVKKMLTKVLDFISWGKFSDAMKKYGYDQFFHLAILLTVESKDGVRKILTVEKNAVLNINSNTKNSADAEIKEVPLDTPGLTLNVALNRVKAKMGDKYFKYDAFTNNCQDFIKAFLEENDLSNPDLVKWLYQDISLFRKEIPVVTKTISSALTTTGAVVDKLLGNGKPMTPLEMLVIECMDCARK